MPLTMMHRHTHAVTKTTNIYFNIFVIYSQFDCVLFFTPIFVSNEVPTNYTQTFLVKLSIHNEN